LANGADLESCGAALEPAVARTTHNRVPGSFWNMVGTSGD
jgi:hypothetical protein